ncbi:hypothetical protein DENSPDRAFT_627581 [Dentipellis sp. KUC8613]|nr:hypothetical protein DENSPDRAFT_627581 [Dentipellis sp. KUC8613]
MRQASSYSMVSSASIIWRLRTTLVATCQQMMMARSKTEPYGSVSGAAAVQCFALNVAWAHAHTIARRLFGCKRVSMCCTTIEQFDSVLIDFRVSHIGVSSKRRETNAPAWHLSNGSCRKSRRLHVDEISLLGVFRTYALPGRGSSVSWYAVSLSVVRGISRK